MRRRLLAKIAFPRHAAVFGFREFGRRCPIWAMRLAPSRPVKSLLVKQVTVGRLTWVGKHSPIGRASVLPTGTPQKRNTVRRALRGEGHGFAGSSEATGASPLSLDT
jgi:hypothetical protein